nr:luminal-binding protein 5 [Tanacetum cinerariifolium]
MSEAQLMPLTGSFNYGNGHMNGVISLRSFASRVVLNTWHQLDKDLMEIFYKSFQWQDRYQYEDNVAPEIARHVWEGRAKIRFRDLWVQRHHTNAVNRQIRIRHLVAKMELKHMRLGAKMLIGDGAKYQGALNAGKTIFDVKRLIGRKSPKDLKLIPYKIVNKDENPYIQVQKDDENKVCSPEEISAMILTKMKETTEVYLGSKVKGAVVTVPGSKCLLQCNPSSNPTPSTNPNPKGHNCRRSKQRIEEFNLDEISPPIVMMADQRAMTQLLQAPTEGYDDAIVVPAITTDNFELKHGLLTLVQNKKFFGHDKEDPHAHIRYFNKITSTLKFPNVPNTSIKLMLFSFSFKGALAGERTPSIYFHLG